MQCRICRVHVLENRCPANPVLSGVDRCDSKPKPPRSAGTEVKTGWLSFAKRPPKRHCAISREYSRGKRSTMAVFRPFDLPTTRTTPLCALEWCNADVAPGPSKCPVRNRLFNGWARRNAVCTRRTRVYEPTFFRKRASIKKKERVSESGNRLSLIIDGALVYHIHSIRNLVNSSSISSTP